MGQFDNIAPEVIAKAKACKSPDELLALAKDEGYELSDDQLEAVSGGWDACDCYAYDEEDEHDPYVTCPVQCTDDWQRWG